MFPPHYSNIYTLTTSGVIVLLIDNSTWFLNQKINNESRCFWDLKSQGLRHGDRLFTAEVFNRRLCPSLMSDPTTKYRSFWRDHYAHVHCLCLFAFGFSTGGACMKWSMGIGDLINVSLLSLGLSLWPSPIPWKSVI